MQFNSTRFAGDPGTYQNAISPNLAAFAGTFNPVQQIGTAMNAASSMNKAGLAQQGIVGKALQEARAIVEVNKYETDLLAAQNAAQTQQASNNVTRNFISDIAGTALGSINFGGGPGIGKGAEFGEVGTSGSDMAAFGYTPAEDLAFHSGAGVYWES